MNITADTVIESFRLQPVRDPVAEGNQSLFEELSQETPSPEMYSSLFERLEQEAKLVREDARRQAHERLWELARQQGVKPIRSVEDLKGGFWPEEESMDEFLSWLHDLRQNDKPRGLPE